MFLPTSDKLLALSEADGSETASVGLPQNCSTSCSGAISEKKLLQPTERGVSYIDTESMTTLRSRSLDGEIASDCSINDGLGYFSVKLDGGYEFMCVDLGSDGLETVWSVEMENQPTSAALQGDWLIWGCGDELYTHHYKQDMSNVIPLGKAISGAPFATEYAVFFSTEDGNAGKLRLNPDGTLEEDTLTWCEVGKSPVSPVSWNGRLYVPTADGFYILDNLNMEISYIITDIKGGCTPQVHYGNGPYIYTVAKREDKWAVYCVQDMDEKSEPTVAILAQMEDYTSGAFCASDKGRNRQALCAYCRSIRCVLADPETCRAPCSAGSGVLLAQKSRKTKSRYSPEILICKKIIKCIDFFCNVLYNIDISN